jgi:hypothetical protein
VSEQINLLGDHAQPTDRQLGPTQRVVMRKLRRLGTLSKAEVGAIAHVGRGKHKVDETCMFCGVDGEPICQSLVHRQLAEWTPEGDIRLAQRRSRVQPPTVEDDVDPFPEGF